MKTQISILLLIFNVICYSQVDYTIIPFQSICGIIPDETRVSEAIKKLGNPEKTEYTKEIKVADLILKATKTYKYPKLGLTFTVEGAEINNKNGVISEIRVTSPFRIYANINFKFGMPKKEAIELLTQKYDCVRDKFNDSTGSYFQLNKNAKLTFALTFKNNFLESIDIFRSVVNYNSTEDSGKKDVETVVEKYSGNGAVNTRPFHIDSSWGVKWNAKGEYFSISLYTTDNEMLDILANQSGSGEGSSFYPRKGNYFFKVNALGDWKIEVIKLN